MVARVMAGEIDAVRIRLDDAIGVFHESVLPVLREEDGYRGAYVLVSDEAKMLALTFWETEQAAEAGIAGARSSSAEQIEKFTTFYRSPPGRETYSVALADPPPS